MLINNNINAGNNVLSNSMLKNSLSKVKNISNKAQNAKQDNELMKVSKEFESLFINELYKSMRKTVDKSDTLFGDGGMQEEVFEDMLYNEYAKLTSESGGIGLSKMIYDSLSKRSQNVSKL